MCSVFQLIVFLNTVLFESIVGNLSTVGKYPELNSETCGLSRHTIGMNTTCLKWHKDKLSPVRGARNVSYGDAPWIANILFDRRWNSTYTGRFLCTGAVVSEQWVITAAHFMIKNAWKAFNIRTYLGHKRVNYSDYFDITNESYTHPNYSSPLYDIALIKMTKPINTSADPLFVNSICLPQKWDIIKGDCKFWPKPNCNLIEYGMSAGFGNGNYNETYIPQIGYWRLWNMRYSLLPTTRSEAVLKTRYVGTQIKCAGDSGGPYWQYDMARAVIVGVVSVSSFDVNKCETPDGENFTSDATFVDQSMDWIIHIITNK